MAKSFELTLATTGGYWLTIKFEDGGVIKIHLSKLGAQRLQRAAAGLGEI